MNNIKTFSIGDDVEINKKLQLKKVPFKIIGMNFFIEDIEPTEDVGDVDDFYVYKPLNKFYKKTTTGWYLIGINFLSGDVDPDMNIGNDGDLYLNYSTFLFFKKCDGYWCTICGLMGLNGKDGIDYDTLREDSFLMGNTHLLFGNIKLRNINFDLKIGNNTLNKSILIRGLDISVVDRKIIKPKLLNGYRYSGIVNEHSLSITGHGFFANKNFQNLSTTNFNASYGTIEKHILEKITLNNGNSGCTDITTPTGTYPGNYAFTGGVLLPDGRVFCIPYGSSSARIYDPATDTRITPTGTYPAGYAFCGGVLLPDGRVFMVPFNSATARIYDPITDTLITPNGAYPGSSAFIGGVLLPDGRVFCVPYNSTSARIYDPITDTTIVPTGIYSGTYDFSGGVLLPDGRVFCVPSTSTTARITTPAPTYKFDLPVILGPTYNKF